ncbi:pentatricopeptide repeat-containing protein At5g43790 [Andrographis paniculata]|uniref:pentatricopeptide repeat-containing protein At5g43790 n=1 Tax=Andrographis paniculata TaxID=175694 RepID=UPI0021E9A74D|nr:pentatricopeptide repeat-containing protein At5g43790 [Andrographis paniculata]XP_051134816.1 pentatricopeptide repeat-containing protein At5g43790 [Andrographis paniculata]
MRSISPRVEHPILHLLQKCKTFDTLKQVHAQMITSGLILHTYPVSRILHLSLTLATLSYTMTIFNLVQNPTIFLYNTLISSLVQKGQVHVSISLYNQILACPDHNPNSYTYPSLFKAFGARLLFRNGRTLHGHVLKFLDTPYDSFVQASLLNFYSRCGRIAVARYFFDQIRNPDLATWNSILSAYARNSTSSDLYGSTSSSMEALNLFSHMQMSLIKPNEVTLVALITACAELGAVGQGAWAHVYVLRNNLSLNRFIGTALISLYANLGCLNVAWQVFDELSQKDTLCFNAMIRGLAIHGHGLESLDLFKMMKREGFLPDDVTILAVMSACSHVGLVEEGLEHFESMVVDYRLEPKLEHYSCLVDLLGRAGLLEEAQERIATMPMKPNAIVWRSLLGAARVHGNVEMCEVALKKLVELEPETSGNYVLLSNVYACTNRWSDVKRVRQLMKDHGVDKMPGSSLVEVNGSVHEFLIGDKSHPRAGDIYSKLEEMNMRLQEFSHRPRTREVMFDIEEEEKEGALSYHSERLAIAFALLASDDDDDDGSRRAPTIRIIKNLRVCVDCHSTTKLLSMVYKREIIVRDRTRFHHFSNGTCSCFDYW